MKSIKEKAEEYGRGWYKRKVSLSSRCRGCYAHVLSSYEAGANYVLNAIEEFMATMNLGSNAAEKFYKSDLMADIHEFIEQLKSNQ